MDLTHSTKEQVEELINFLWETSQESPPSEMRWSELTLALREHAWFTKEIVWPKIPDPKPTANRTEVEYVMPPARPNILRASGPRSEALINGGDNGNGIRNESGETDESVH